MCMRFGNSGCYFGLGGRGGKSRSLHSARFAALRSGSVCEQRWVSGQELLFAARRVTTIDFSEGRATHNSWRSVTMNDLTTREPANDPQDLERLLVRGIHRMHLAKCSDRRG